MSYVKEVLNLAKKFPVFPAKLIDGKKLPLIKGWPEKATQDREQVNRWFSKEFKGALVGVPTGSKSGIVAVDIDVKGDVNGFESLKDLPELPKTLSQKTPSGGKHYIYEAPELLSVPNTTSRLCKGVDTRGDRGYIVMAPSEGYELEDGEIVELPDWVLDKIRHKEPESKSKALPEKYDAVHREELRMLLNNIDVTKHRDRNSWRDIIIMCKSASKGEHYGLDLVLNWSLKDSEYFTDKEVEEEARKIWDSVDVTKEGGLTYKSLYHLANKTLAKVEESKEPESVGFVEVSKTAMLQYCKKTKTLKKTDLNIKNLIDKPEFLEYGETEPTDSPFYNMFAYNELEQSVIYAKHPYYRPKSKSLLGERLNESAYVAFMCELQKPPFNCVMSKSRIQDVIDMCAIGRSFNPLTEYLDSLVWDGVPRLESYLIDMCGVEDNEYSSVVTKYLFMSAVSRAYEPGCKADNMVIFEGHQGVGKSELVRMLGGRWSGTPKINLSSKDSEENLMGIWIAEIAELNGLGLRNKSKVEQLKDYISVMVPIFRKSYGRVNEKVPRRCIFVGTTNPEGNGQYLSDSTGNRRFLPLVIPGCKEYMTEDGVQIKIDFESIGASVSKVWAEAVSRYKAGEKHRLTPQEEALCKVEQNKRYMQDPWQEIVEIYLNRSHTDFFTTSDIAINCLDIDKSKLDQRTVRRVASVLKLSGLEPSLKRVDGRMTRGFCKPIVAKVIEENGTPLESADDLE